MDSEIVFGQVEHQPPEREVRPDRNRQFSVVACGTIDQQDLPVFVDLDVMRDMEGHARTNMHVELGGVLLGGQYLDSDDQPFVVVREALRAEHYEATRGSFKFTHDTWEQITRDREQFPKDLQLIGWYHTHPDWGVFLSGMDMFICEHFFGKDLDVALVIDPCRGDRGWFYWRDEAGQRRKIQSASFYLMANRYRQGELTQFASMLSKPDPAFFDPRYNLSSGETAVQPVVNIHEQRSTGQSIALIGMLTVQLLVVALIAYRVLLSPAADQTAKQEAAEKQQTYDSILSYLVTADPQSRNLVEHYQQVEQENRILRSNVKGQVALSEQQEREKSELAQKLATKLRDLNTAKKNIELKNSKITNLESTLELKEVELAEAQGEFSFWRLSVTWPVALSVALMTAAVGAFAGVVFARRRMFDEFDDEEDAPISQEERQPEAKESPLPRILDDDTSAQG